MVAGKSLAIISLTAQVWHPMGRPSGLARSSRAPAEKRPAAAALVAEYLRNSLLEMAGIWRFPFSPSRPRGGCTTGDEGAHKCGNDGATKPARVALSEFSPARRNLMTKTGHEYSNLP